MPFTNEGNHPLEFLLSEAPGYRSRETGTVKSGENVVAGEVLAWSSGELIALPGNLDSNLVLDDSIAGIATHAADATSAAVPVTYIARDAEVSEGRLTYPTETSPGGEKAATDTALATLNIHVRTGNTVPTA